MVGKIIGGFGQEDLMAWNYVGQKMQDLYSLPSDEQDMQNVAAIV